MKSYQSMKIQNGLLLALALSLGFPGGGMAQGPALPKEIHCLGPVSILPNQPTKVGVAIDASLQALKFEIFNDVGGTITEGSNAWQGGHSSLSLAAEGFGSVLTAKVTGEIPGRCPSRNCGSMVPFDEVIQLHFKPFPHELDHQMELVSLTVNGHEKLGYQHSLECAFTY